MTHPRTTLARPVRVTGRGLHTGDPVWVELRPAACGAGRGFTRHGGDRIAARLGAVVDTRLATTLGNGAWQVSTVEHLLAAAYALGVDDLDVEVRGGELPILDGSAAPWVDALERAGQVPHGGRRRWLRPGGPLSFQRGSRGVWLEPGLSKRLRVAVEIDFAHPAIGQQHAIVALQPGDAAAFAAVAAARTFGFSHEVDALRAQGRARGGSLDNAVVFDATGPVNPGGLRHPSEPARHKLLDLIGDLALLDAYVEGQVRATRPGHAVTHAALRSFVTSLGFSSATADLGYGPVVDSPASVGHG